MEILKTGLVYLPSFREMYNENALNSDIVKFAESTIKENVNNGILGDERYKIDLPWDYVVTISEMAMVGMNPSYINKSTTALKEYTKNMLNKDISYEMAYNMALQSVGVTKVPSSILLSPTSFDAKQDFINYIASWNQTEDGKTNKIIYTDATSMLTNTMGQMIDIISYVLIAFAGISLVVSSVMIGIITYTSVIERTKEIGILRSIGARKKDISRIFNSETILVGFFSGLLGVFISWLLTFPISAIIKAVAGGAITTSMAILEFGDALILIIISTLLTTIAGTVPAKIASKKDPVRCLRSE
jgi:putative ABC transport system permease protein